MKKITPIVAISILCSVSIAAAFTSVIAWFSASAKITNENNPVEGASLGAYFAYGDGSEEHPFGITKSRHLYNLAWLQYLNHFNKKTDNTGKIIPTYFELGDDVVGEGMAIPPIGDAAHPFVGTFNGNGYTISDFVISNNASDFTVKPAAVTSYTPSEIVGLFGVVGKLASDATTSYDTATNEIFDVGISDLTIKSNTANTLVGIVAGYVNGTISKVAVSDSTINIVQSGASAVTSIGTTNLSDYTIVGYCTDTYKRTLQTIDNTIYDVTPLDNVEFNATDSGDVQGWGGSINMLDMFNRLHNIEKVASSGTRTYKTITEYDADGEVIGTPTTSTYTYYRYSNRPAMGNFSYINQNDSYMYLQGGERVVNKYNTYYEHTGYPITDGTNYLCADDSSVYNMTGAKAQTGCTLWDFEEDGGEYLISTTYNGTTYYLSYVNDELDVTTSATTYWIIDDTGTYRDIYFDKKGDEYHLTYSNGWTVFNTSGDPYYVIYDDAGHYIAEPTNDYALSADSIAGAAHFGYSTSARGYYLLSNTSKYLGMYRTNSYQCQIAGDDNYYYRLVNSSGNLLANPYGDGYMRAFNKNSDTAYNTYYIRYTGTNNQPWTSGNNSQKTAMHVLSVDPTSFTPNILKSTQIIDPPHEGPDYYSDDSRKESYMSYTATNTTYFPLNVKTDGGTYSNASTANNRINSGNYDPTDANTGYVISGSNIGENTTITNGGPSLIRVSKYAISNINASYTSSDGEIKDTKVYTHNQAGNRVTIANDTFNYEKYSDSKKTLYDNVLKNQSNVYGLHFMSSQISKSDIVTANNISILGESYGTYQLPVNSIDFNLKEKGYINFFAGTYFSSTVTSFFSLHKVIRNSSGAITDIKEIEAIYGNATKRNYSYAYKYTDGTYSKPYRFDGNKNQYEMSQDDSGVVPFVDNDYLTEASFNTYITTYNYSPIFNTSRITNIRNGATINSLTQNALYYFEIPMNNGEYCLGSVDGGTGGYLIYLDIGANAAKTERTSIIEHFIRTVKEYEYPLGVAFLPVNKAGDDEFDETDTVCVYVAANYQGELFIERESDTSIEVARSGTTYSKPTYLSDSVTTLHDSGGASIKTEIIPKSSNTYETLRLQYYDYNVTLGEVIRTIITDTRVNNGSYTRTVKQYYQNGDEWVERAESDIKIYSSTTGVKLDLADVLNRNSGTITFNSTTTVVLVQIHYIVPGGVTSEEVVELNLVVDEDNTTGTYYKFDDYTIKITPTGGSITVEVIQLGSKKIVIGTTTVTTVGQKIVIPAA